VIPGAAGDVTDGEILGATWRGLKAPAEVVLVAAEVHARRGKANPRRLSSPEQQTEAAADCLGDRERGAHK